MKDKIKLRKLYDSFIRDKWGNLTNCYWNQMIKDDINNLITRTMENYKMKLEDLNISPEMTVETFYYKGFTFQRMTKDSMWYVIYANHIVNCGQYRSDLAEWIDIQEESCNLKLAELKKNTNG
jgi:CRISPR/Cas system CMR-associated protein Cmr5 small subunit